MARVSKVLMLIENRPAPADARVWPEALALVEAGYEVTVISPKGPAPHGAAHDVIDNIHIYRYHLPAGHSMASYIAEYAISVIMTFWLSLRVWLRHGFDVIHSANPPDTFFVIGLFYRLFGKKYVFDQHDLTPELFQAIFTGGAGETVARRGPRLLHWLLLALERWSYNASHLVITTNLSFKRIAETRGHCAPDKIAVVRNGPNLDLFTRGATEPLLKPEGQYLLVYLGVMGAQDGVDNAIRAMHELVHARGRQDVRLLLMGGGDALPALRTLTHELALDPYVQFNGPTPKPEVVRILSSADIGLVPDPANGVNEYCTMIKAMEYMAMEVPIVAFDLIETRYSAQDAGIYATPNRVDEFADKIEALLADAELRRQMGAAGRARVEAELSWAHSKRNLITAYRDAFGAPSAQAQPMTPEMASSARRV